MIFPENIGEHLSIDEVSLSHGELYTFVTNKNGRCKKRTLVACIKGTKSEIIVKTLQKLPLESRNKVKEITLDMAKNMESAAKEAFPNASLVTDRFHVVKLAIDALQHIRVKLRWKELDKENRKIAKAKSKKVKYKPKVFSNGDTPKQLLARSKFILNKKPFEWTASQKLRAKILFDNFPVLENAYQHIIDFRAIYDTKFKNIAKIEFNKWINKTLELKNNEFNSVCYSLEYHMENILNFFDNRNTNANAESFNSKIKLFRANLRGVTDTTFFLFRLYKLFA
jgi:transposase